MSKVGQYIRGHHNTISFWVCAIRITTSNEDNCYED